jgi:hypothetical protein
MFAALGAQVLAGLLGVRDLHSQERNPCQGVRTLDELGGNDQFRCIQTAQTGV